MSNRPGRGGSGSKVAGGCAMSGCALAAGAIFVVLLFLVIIAGAATAMVQDPIGSVIGWLTGNGPPDPNHRPSNVAPRGIELYTVTPRPANCGITPTPVIITATADPQQPTPPGTYAGAPISLPTATPCPTPYSHLNTPDPRWTPMPGGSGPHGWPIHGTITQNFGCTDVTLEPAGGGCAHFHWGLDISDTGGAGCGSTMHSTITGTVVYASHGFVQWQRGNPSPYSGYGNVVGIVSNDGTNTWRTVYAHLCRTDVEVGQQIVAGQPIGVEGSSGSSDGTHVHYEVWLNGELRDPLPYLNR